MRYPRLVALVVAALVVTGGGYILFQPLQPDLSGGGAGFTVAHVGTTYVCGNVLALGSDQAPVEVVRARAVGVGRDAAAVRLFVATPDSELYGVGALGLLEAPGYGDPGIREPADFTLDDDAPAGQGRRVHLAVTPRRLGPVELESIEVTYRPRPWLPTSTLSVPSRCSIAVTATGPDPTLPG